MSSLKTVGKSLALLGAAFGGGFVAIALGLGSVATELGPASAVTFDGSPALRLTNSGGRAAWGEGAARRAWGIASVDVGILMTALMESPRIKAVLEPLQDEGRKQDEGFRRRWADLNQRMEAAPDEEAGQAIVAEAEAFQHEVRAWQAEFTKRFEAANFEAHAAAWTELREAADLVAERAGADIVLKSPAPGDPLRAGDSDFLATQVRSRSLVRAPEGLDITDDVLKELNLARPDLAELDAERQREMEEAEKAAQEEER